MIKNRAGFWPRSKIKLACPRNLPEEAEAARYRQMQIRNSKFTPSPEWHILYWDCKLQNSDAQGYYKVFTLVISSAGC